MPTSSHQMLMLKENADVELHQYGSETVILSNLPSLDPDETWENLQEHRKAANLGQGCMTVVNVLTL